MIKNKLIKARKERYTQESMAKILHMTQSQYQRREKGEIKISDEEWERMAKALDTTVEDIREDDIPQRINDNYDNNSGNYYPHVHNNYNIPEFILENQQEYINLLKKQIEELKEEIKSLKS
ncbi:DNA-binding transcriptional regulator, XRE-family HTH domain [Chryseobacterium oleae]|uniref:DNA-binding transcriptional regulator, XRE-family HTH domain n=1 Tax=Chryseobacterium oleae TaxID=491207 RepID=A0A1I4XTU0_CHROL|nr:helix-turn-helix transcriptional regulator [Chryseobacterium oleae]SFN29187.1 DNA-binding transcriptional regulator, XRE-family HTH domain [Chryseobacterium oleae]